MDCFFERQKSYYNYNTFQKILDESDLKPNKMWVDKGSEFLQQIKEIMVTRQKYRNLFNT